MSGDEGPSIPRRLEPMQIAAYAPLAAAPFTPDLVVFRSPRQLMLLSEAARSAGVLNEEGSFSSFVILHFSITSTPPMYGRKASGTTTEPSAC
jgi:hypothetical protein